MKTKWYYKVKPEFDGKKILVSNDGQHFYCTHELIGNELLTFDYCCAKKIPEKYLDRVKINSIDVYWFFGARFSIQYPFTDVGNEA